MNEKRYNRTDPMEEESSQIGKGGGGTNILEIQIWIINPDLNSSRKQN
jgi:hypothetical protein